MAKIVTYIKIIYSMYLFLIISKNILKVHNNNLLLKCQLIFVKFFVLFTGVQNPSKVSFIH